MVKFVGMELTPSQAQLWLYIFGAIAVIQVLAWLGFDVLSFLNIGGSDEATA